MKNQDAYSIKILFVSISFYLFNLTGEFMPLYSSHRKYLSSEVFFLNVECSGHHCLSVFCFYLFSAQHNMLITQNNRLNAQNRQFIFSKIRTKLLILSTTVFLIEACTIPEKELLQLQPWLAHFSFQKKTLLFLQPHIDFCLRVRDALYVCGFIVKIVHEVPNTFILKEMFQIILVPNNV